VNIGIAYSCRLDRIAECQRAVAASWSKVPSMTPDPPTLIRPLAAAASQTLVRPQQPLAPPVDCPALPFRHAPCLCCPFSPLCGRLAGQLLTQPVPWPSTCWPRQAPSCPLAAPPAGAAPAGRLDRLLVVNRHNPELIESRKSWPPPSMPAPGLAGPGVRVPSAHLNTPM